MGQIMKLAATMAMGILLLPTHVVAQPTVDFPEITTKSLGLNPITMQTNHRGRKINSLRAYPAVMDRWNSIMNPDPLESRWAIEKVLGSREVRKEGDDRMVFLKVQFQDGPTKWMGIDELQLADPYLAINHAINHDLKYQEGYSWVQTYIDYDDDVVEMVHALKVAAKESKKYKFGVEVPKSTKRAFEIDMENGTQAWKESIDLELKQIKDYEVFKVLEPNEPTPPGYKRIPYLLLIM